VQNVVSATDSSRLDSSFAVTVINNEDNNDIYTPPEGVRGAQDRVYGITSKEQALVLKLSNFQQWSQGRAIRIFSQSQEASLVNYKYIKMYMHGDQNVDDLNAQHLEFFFRMGRDDDNYYEYRTQLKPGWQQMVLDMDFLAQLKAVDSLAVASGSGFPARDPTGKIYFEENTTIFADTTSGNHTELVVHGQPSLGKVRQMEVGARNFTGRDHRSWKNFGSVGTWPAYNGQIWLNELRVTGVSRSGGMAYRAQASLDLADVMSVRMSTNQVNADFHRVDNQWGDNMNTDGMDVNVSFNAHKFVPDSWGLRIPIHARYSQNHQVPKYLPGSDVLTSSLNQALASPAAVRDTISKIEAFSMQRSYGTSFSKNSRSKFWLGKYTLDAIRLSYDVTQAYLRNETQKYSTNSKNIIQGSYNLNFAQGKGLNIFKFLKFLPIYGQALSESKFQYKPSRLSISGLLTENSTARAYRQGARDPNLSYSQVLQRQFSLGYNPFRTMNFSYNKRMDSNVSEFRHNRFDMLRYMKPGIVTGVNENFSGSFSPVLASWFKPTMQYQSGYRYQNSVNEERRGVDVGYSQQASISTVLDLKRIKEGVSGRNQPGSSGRPGRPTGRPGQTTRPGTPQDTTAEKGSGLPGLGDIFNGFLNNIQPINLTYSNSRNGNHNNLIRAPGIQYRLGWKVDPDVPVDSLYLGNADNRNVDISKNFALRTGYNFSRDLTATINYSYGDAKSFSQIQATRNVNKDFFLTQFSPKNYHL
ncbi:MAG: cell surface protein SprA, partial [Calditrichota bacterium]